MNTCETSDMNDSESMDESCNFIKKEGSSDVDCSVFVAQRSAKILIHICMKNLRF